MPRLVHVVARVYAVQGAHEFGNISSGGVTGRDSAAEVVATNRRWRRWVPGQVESSATPKHISTEELSEKFPQETPQLNQRICNLLEHLSSISVAQSLCAH